MAKRHDIQVLEQRIKGLRVAMWELAQRDSLEELLQHIHRPGWTTPAELAFVEAFLDQLESLTRMVGTLRTQLVRASAMVGQAVPVLSASARSAGE